MHLNLEAIGAEYNLDGKDVVDGPEIKFKHHYENDADANLGNSRRPAVGGRRSEERIWRAISRRAFFREGHVLMLTNVTFICRRIAVINMNW
jgi:hypothetical protein